MKIPGLIGAFLVFSAVFLPMASVPLAGRMSLAAASGFHAAVLIVLSLLAGVFAVRNSRARLAATGFGMLLVMAMVYVRAKSGDLFAAVGHKTGFLGGIRKSLHAAAFNNVHYEWGLWVMLAGLVLLVTASFSGPRKPLIRSMP